jgi:hypothetical protein
MPLSPLTTLKLALVASGILLFGVGVRTGRAAYQWAAIVLLGIAFVLRFIGPAGRR